MTRNRCLQLDRPAMLRSRAAVVSMLMLGAGMLAGQLSGCVRYASNRDHLEREALVLSPTDDAPGRASTRSTIGVRN